MVKFVNYTGEYPNLCAGVLTVEINGEEVKFGHRYDIHDSWLTDGNEDSFWTTGGRTGFYSMSEAYTEHDEWILNISELSDKYKPYAEELIEVFNENVPWGCCGGCI